MSDEEYIKAFEDAAMYGSGFFMDGKRISQHEVFMNNKDKAREIAEFIRKRSPLAKYQDAANFVERQQLAISDLERRNKELVEAAKTGANWMRFWIENNECDCDDAHHCGKLSRIKELDAINKAIANSEGKA